jgi:hypothetical protein
MAAPYDLFLRYLATTGIDNLDEVNAKLDDLNLPKLVGSSDFTTQLKLVFDSVPPGIASQIENKTYGPDFLNWMGVLEVKDLWLGEKRFLDPTKKSIIKLVYDINQDHQLKTAINALLIKKTMLGDIVQTVSSKFSALIQEAHISIYTRFFFDPCRMTRKDWKSYLRACSVDEVKVYTLALTEPLDVVKTELGLPSKVSVCDSMQFLLSKAILKSKSYLNVATPEGNREARAWIDTVIKLSDKYEKYRSGDSDDFAKTLQLKFEFVDSEFAHPDDETVKELKAAIEMPESPFKKKT